MSVPAPSFVDRHGRTWPGPTHLDGREVSDVDLQRKLVIVRTGFCSFESVDPDNAAYVGWPDGEKPRVKKPRSPK